MDERLKAEFPKLSHPQDKKTSEADPGYNCIAWAFKDNQKWWWPHKRAFWPKKIRNLTPMEAFDELFIEDGWEETEVLKFEEGYEKIALFSKNGNPTHAARLLKNGKWTSKLGGEIDIMHDLHELEGPAYGNVVKIYRKRIL